VWWPGAEGLEDRLNDAVILLASVTGWSADFLETLGIHQLIAYVGAATRVGAITEKKASDG
jgi:hypothetical protein